MTPTLYNNYELKHPNFKSRCTIIFSDLIGNDSWFSNSNSNTFSPFKTEEEEFKMWKEYNNTKSNFIRDKLVSKYIWLIFRIFLSFGIMRYNRNRDELLQESLIQLWNCVINFDTKSDNSFFSYFCVCLKHKLKTLRAMYMGRKVVNLSGYDILDSRALRMENQNNYIKDSPLAIKLCKKIGLGYSKNQKIKELTNYIDELFFREPCNIYTKSPEDEEEVILLEDKLDYNFDAKTEFIESRIDTLNEILILLYRNKYINNKRSGRITEKSLQLSLDILFYTCGFIKTSKGYKQFADYTTQVEAADYFGFTRQGISVRLEVLCKYIKSCCTKKDILNILNGTIDVKDICKNIGEK